MHRIAVPLAALLLMSSAAPAFAGAGLPMLASLQVGPHRAVLHNSSPALTTGPNTITLAIESLTSDQVVSLRLDGPSGEGVAVPLRKVIVLDGPAGGHGAAEGAHADEVADGHGSEETDSHGLKPADDHGTAVATTHAVEVEPAHGRVAEPARDVHAAGAQQHGSTSLPQAAQALLKHEPVAAGRPETRPAESHGASPSDSHAGASPDDHVLADAHAGATLHLGEDAHGDAQTHASESYLARGSVSIPSTGAWIATLIIRDQHGEILLGQAPLEVVEGGPSRLYLGATGALILGSMLFGMIQRRRLPARAPKVR